MAATVAVKLASFPKADGLTEEAIEVEVGAADTSKVF